MMSLSHRSVALTGFLLLGAVTPSSGQLPPLDELMRSKLDHTQRLLEAVVLRQHVTVERYASELLLLSDATTWTSLQSDEYMRYAFDFQDSAQELMEAARLGDEDGVALAFSELVFGCGDCHAYVGREDYQPSLGRPPAR